MPKWKLKPMTAPRTAKRLDQDAANELLGGEVGERRIEGEHDRAVEPGRGQEPQFGRLVGEPEQLFVRMEEGARMRLEGERRGRAAEPVGALQRGGDDDPVAAMHAVEIADGNDRAAQAIIARAVAHDEEAFCRHRPAMVKKLLHVRCRRGRRRVKSAAAPDSAAALRLMRRLTRCSNPQWYLFHASGRHAQGTTCLDYPLPTDVDFDRGRSAGPARCAPGERMPWLSIRQCPCSWSTITAP